LDRDKAFIALGVALLLVASAIVGALAVTGEEEDHYDVAVEITNPEEGAVVANVVMVSAEYHSNIPADLAILKVDGETLAYSQEGPFEWELDTSDYLDGEHRIEVVVRNEKGRVGSAAHDIIINNGGTAVSIRSPSDGATVTGQVELKVDAVSPRGIAYVSVRVDGMEVGNKSSAPFTWELDTRDLGNGPHSIQALVSDELEVTAQAQSIITVDNPFIIIDERGKSITFDGVPQRILSMGSSFTEVFYAISADSHIVGVDSSSKYPAEVSQKINVGSFYTVNTEAVLAANPDCVVTWSFATTTISTLESNGMKVVCYNPGSVNGVFRVINSLGNLTGHQSDAISLVQDMRARIHAVELKVAGVPESQRPQVYFELRSGKSVGPGTIADELITIAGGKNIYASASIKYPLFNSEYIISSDPDVIVIENQSAKTNAQIEGIAGWETITAVQDHRILRINGELVSSTPRLVDALEQLEAYFYPD
jgi:iron complex transport system substrate-binding protein